MKQEEKRTEKKKITKKGALIEKKEHLLENTLTNIQLLETKKTLNF